MSIKKLRCLNIFIKHSKRGKTNDYVKMSHILLRTGILK